MRKPFTTLLSSLFVLAMIFSIPLSSKAQGQSQNREKFVISARAGGVNAVTGRATMRTRGNAEWEQLTIKEDLETGDAVRTGADGRVEMLLNPGSYLRVGENSEFELTDNSLSNLEVRLTRGTAIVEVTGVDDEELLIGISTPHARMSIVRRGLYRVSVVPGNTTELIVRKGRVMLEDSHTKIKGGNKVVFSDTTFYVAKLTDDEKNDRDMLGGWSKDRAKTLAQANSKISGRTLLASYRNFGSLDSGYGRSGFWYFSQRANCYTFVPFGDYWGSPYGGHYSTYFYGGPSWGGNYGRPIITGAGQTGRTEGSAAGVPTRTPAASAPRPHTIDSRPMRMPGGGGDRPSATPRVKE